MLSALVQSSPLPVVVLDIDGYVTMWNPAAEDVFGWTEAEALGRPLPFVPGEAWDEFLSNMSAVVKGEHFKGLGLRRIKKDGSPIDLRLWAAPLREQDGVVSGIMGILQDVTEYKQAEEALRESEERLSLALAAADMGTWDMDLRTGRIVWSERRFRMFGYEPAPSGEAAFEMWRSRVHPEDLPWVSEALERSKTGQSPYNLEYRILRADTGEMVWLSVAGHAIFDETGEAARFVGTSLDVTERRQSEQGLRQTNEMLSALIDSYPLAIDTLDRDGHVTSWNAAAEAEFGWTEDEVLGRFLPIVPAEAKDEYLANLSMVLAGNTLRGIEARRVRKDGSFVDLRIWAAPLRDCDGQITGCVAELEDITERKQLKAELRQSQRMEAVGRLAGGMAHEFKNLLMGISGYAEILQMKLEPDHPQSETANELMRCVDRAATVLGKLQAFSRRQSLDIRPTDINALVSESEHLMERLLGEHIEMTLDLSDEPAIANVDPVQIEQVLTNLTINARDAMPRGGRLVMNTRIVNAEDMTVSQLGPDLDHHRYVEISIADSGSGMDEATMSQVFEPFFTTKGSDGRMGLGLSVTYGIVSQHKGLIDVQSRPGEGTSFLVYLPIAEEAAAADVKSAVLQPKAGTETILLAEDEDIVRAPVKSLLESYGYIVLAASDGEEAIKLFERHADEIDLAVLDLVMPKASGKYVWYAIREIRPDMKILFMSGHAATSVHEDFMPPPDVPFLSKPFSVMTLVGKIREMLDSESAAQSKDAPEIIR